MSATERKTVDVLADMDNAAEHLEAVKHYGTCDDLREARAAVAELIRLTLAIDAECGNAKPDFGKVCALAAEAAALARVGGA